MAAYGTTICMLGCSAMWSDVSAMQRIRPTTSAPIRAWSQRCATTAIAMQNNDRHFQSPLSLAKRHGADLRAYLVHVFPLSLLSRTLRSFIAPTMTATNCSQDHHSYDVS
jgi:hypothetical protein